MAKIKARGAREVARWEAVLSGADGERTFSYRYLVVLTTDGRLLRRVADAGLQGGYTIIATFKAGENKTQDGARTLSPAELVEARKFRVERFLTRKGYVLTPMAVR